MEYFKFTCPVILKVTGEDSTRYLNSRLTNDIKNLPIHHAVPAGALTAQGKTQALVTVFKVSNTEYLVYADTGSKETIHATVRQFVVADRVEVHDVSEHFSLYHISGDLHPHIGEKEILIRRNRGWSDGADVLVSVEREQDFQDLLKNRKTSLVSQDDFRYRRIRAHIPAFLEELQENTLFSESRYQEAIATNKGCYVGQEVVERVEAFGKTPKIFRVLEFRDNIAPGAEITKGDGTSIGKVLTSATNTDEQKTVAFASLKNDGSTINTEILCGSVKGTILW